MQVVKTIEELKKLVNEYRCEGLVGLVPTMGALHNGHKKLVEQCKKENDFVVASVFVNPTQFNDKKDLVSYPRSFDEDCVLLKEAGCDAVFAPSVEEIYPESDDRIFDFGELATVMEGANRPGHFNGVAQIVSKLFMFVEPDIAYFGEKDFQQLTIIRRMVELLNLNIEIVGVPIVREADGLALSSRNALLSEEQRAVAPNIFKIIQKYADKNRGLSVEETIKSVVKEINLSSLMEVEYFVLADSTSLKLISSWEDSAEPRGFVTVKLGNVRIIDNLKF
ncbi:MAG: pantoate--beta-alanine ligase [Bacteroidetes bacterium]|nr:pantoate--beta-alanine ligase [Bacteroidota bacterium]